MGHGCYYTHNETGTKAFWIDLDYYYQDEETKAEAYDQFLWDDTLLNLQTLLINLGYYCLESNHFSNGLFDLHLDSGYSGEVVFRLEPKIQDGYDDTDLRIYNLGIANHKRSYKRIGKALLDFYSLRIASSGYTSTAYVL